MTDHDHIATLKDAADPQRVAAALGLQGRGSRFLCPACSLVGGKTAALVIRDKGFTCHRCGGKGDLLKLIEVALNIDFPSAVAWLEKETGIPSPGRHKKGPYGDKGRTGRQNSPVFAPQNANFKGLGEQTSELRVTPAMEAGIADHVWTLEEIAKL